MILLAPQGSGRVADPPSGAGGPRKGIRPWNHRRVTLRSQKATFFAGPSFSGPPLGDGEHDSPASRRGRDKRKDEWMDGWMDGWMNGWMDGWMDGGWIDGWMGGWMDGWMDG